MKKYLLIIVLFAFSFSSFGQKRMLGDMVKNYQYVDLKTVNFGFTVGLNFLDNEMWHKQYRSKTNELYFGEVVKANYGFSIGGIAQFKINKYWSLRFNPTLLMGKTTVSFNNILPGAKYITSADQKVPDEYKMNPRDVDISSISFNFPILFKLTSERFGNYRPFMLGGFSFNYDIASETVVNVDQDIFLRKKPMDLCLELGLGVAFYLPFCKLSTELRLSLGLIDILDHNITDKNRKDIKASSVPKAAMYTDNIDRMTSKVFSILIHFE